MSSFFWWVLEHSRGSKHHSAVVPNIPSNGFDPKPRLATSNIPSEVNRASSGKLSSKHRVTRVDSMSSNIQFIDGAFTLHLECFLSQNNPTE